MTRKEVVKKLTIYCDSNESCDKCKLEGLCNKQTLFKFLENDYLDALYNEVFKDESKEYKKKRREREKHKQNYDYEDDDMLGLGMDSFMSF